MPKFFVSLDPRTTYEIEAPNHAAAADAVLDGKGTKLAVVPPTLRVPDRDEQQHDQVAFDARD